VDRRAIIRYSRGGDMPTHAWAYHTASSFTYSLISQNSAKLLGIIINSA
jgi:hypothetical protein